MKRALFIGGTGTISTAVTALALQRGWAVTLLNRGHCPGLAGTESLVADIHDEAAVAALLRGRFFDVVGNFVAYHGEDVRRDIRLFSEHTGQYLLISSASAYQKPPIGARITESTPLANPYWAYSRGKIAAEQVLTEALQKSGFPGTIVRPSHTYNGTKPPLAIHGTQGSWQTMARICAEKSVIIPGDGSSLWTLTHSSDFAKGYVGLMANPHAIGHAFHITSDETMTWNQIYEVIAAALGKPLHAVHISSDFLASHAGPYDLRGELLGDKANTVLFDNSKIKQTVPDFCCTVSMAQGLRESVEFMLTHPDTQLPDPEFDRWCEQILACRRAADAAWQTEVS